MYWFNESISKDWLKTKTIQELLFMHLENDFEKQFELEYLTHDGLIVYHSMNSFEKNELMHEFISVTMREKWQLFSNWNQICAPMVTAYTEKFIKKLSTLGILIQMEEQKEAYQFSQKGSSLIETIESRYVRIKDQHQSKTSPIVFFHEQSTSMNMPLLGIKCYVRISEDQIKQEQFIKKMKQFGKVSVFEFSALGPTYYVPIYLNNSQHTRLIKELIPSADYLYFQKVIQCYWDVYQQNRDQWKTYWRMKM